MRRLWERFKAWRRGEVRVAPPHAKRGRLYAKKDAVQEIEMDVPKTQPDGTVIMARAKVAFQGKVIRADGTEEPLDVNDITLETIEDK